MSNKRVTDSGAELVCSVEKTKCPVSEASIPMDTVSWSRGFRHHDDVRVSPQKRAHQHGKVNACFFIHLHLAQTFLGNFNWVLGGSEFWCRYGSIRRIWNARWWFAGASQQARVKQAIRLVYHTF